MNNILYSRLHEGFTNWLRILNFELTSQRDMPKMLLDFLAFLEVNQCNTITDIQEQHIKSYVAYLYQRTNRKSGGGLSINYIRKHMQVFRKFSRYLTESGHESFSANVSIKDKPNSIRSILTITEIELLYSVASDDLLGLRDKAMLALYYGCGLRKNEGVSMNADEVLLDKELLFVRKGKGYKERYVPLSGHNKTDLENYLHYGRPYLIEGKKEKGRRSTCGLLQFKKHRSNRFCINSFVYRNHGACQLRKADRLCL